MRLRRLGLAAMAVLVALTATACSSIDAKPDEQGLLYQGGPIEGRSFDKCVKTGQKEWGDMVGGEGFIYPAGTRTYTFDNPGDRAAIDIADKDGQPLTVSGILTFQLPSDCDVVREFHEQIGLKYGASGNGVAQWGELLDDYLGQPLRAAMRDAAVNFTWRELYADPAKQDEFAAAVKEALPKYVEDLAKGDYFTNFTLLPQAPVPGGALLKQIEEQNTQTERLNTIEAQKLAQQAEIDQMRQLVELLGPDGYVLYRNQLNCEEGGQGCIPFLSLPNGSGVNITPGG